MMGIKWQFWVWLGVICGVGVGCVVCVRNHWETKNNVPVISQIDLEIVKAALTGCVVAVIGVVLAALGKAREEFVQAARLRADLLGQFTKEVSRIYHAVKGIRRELREVGLTDYYNNPPQNMDDFSADYQRLMKDLNGEQIALEKLKREVRTLPHHADTNNLGSLIRKMEDYLRVILKEKDGAIPQISSGMSVSFVTLVRLREFTGSTSVDSPVPNGPKSEYRLISHFSDPYDDILQEISTSLKKLAAT